LHVLPDLRARAASHLDRGGQGDVAGADAEARVSWLERVGRILLPPGPPPRGVMGVFEYVDDATGAVLALRQAGLRDLGIFSPVPYHDLERAMEQGPSLVRWVCFAGGACGLTGGLALCIYSVTSWPLVTAGKELTSLPPFITICYDSMILLGGI